MRNIEDRTKQIEAMSNALIKVGIDDILKAGLNVKAFKNQLVVEVIKGGSYHGKAKEFGQSIRLDAISMFVVCRGTMNVSIDNKNYRLSENHVLHITDYHILKDISISDDIEAYLVIIEREFFGEIMRFSRRVPESVIAAIHDRPIQSINSEDKLRLKNAVEKIIDSIDRKDSPWQADLIKNDLRGFMIEMSIVTYKAYKEHESDIPSGKNTLFFLFLQLLKTHCREQHEVKFYASEIGIDPGYLSRILKKISGKTTAQWISEAIVREAELLLSLPENNVQSVSDELNFSDQSSFGKFFKKHKGISPLRFQQDKILHG